MDRQHLPWWLGALGTLSLLVVAGACSQEVELTTEEESAALRPPHCGCEDGADDQCQNVITKQWACSYGPPCNYVAYRSDCSFANPCPLATWNGCILQSQVCRETGLQCTGSCSNGVPCSIQYPPPPPRPVPPHE